MNKRRQRWAVGLLGVALLPAAWAADDDSLEALLQREVQGPSRYAQSLLDAPAAVSVIGRRESALLGHATVADMMARLPGIYFSHSRQYISVGMRGLNRPGDYNARLLMAIDGFRSNDATYDQALPEYEFPLVAEWIKRVELVHGPSSSVYGGNALLGVVNLVTQDGADAPGLRLQGSLGSFGSRRAMLQYGGVDAGGGDLFVGANFQRSDGEDLELPELGLPGGRVSGLDGMRHASLFAKYRRGDWRATLSAMQRDKDVPTAPYGTQPGVAGTRYRDRYAHVELSYDEGWRDALRRSLRVGLAQSSFDGRYVYDQGLINRDQAAARWGSVDARLQWKGWLNHDLMLGLDARTVPGVHQRNFDEQPFASVLDSRESSHSLGLYAQDQWRLSESWQLTAGLRLDAIKDFRAEWSPRLALVYRPRPEESIKLMLGRSFRAPNLAERFYADGVSQQANTGLLPERLQTMELAWERSLDAQTALSFNLYQTRLLGMIEIVPIDDTSLGRYENLSRVATRGFDLGVEQRGRSDFHWRIDLSLMQARSAGQRLSNSPSWLLKGHLILPLAAHWSLGLEGQAMGAREGRVRVPGHVLVNGLLRFTGWQGQVLGLRVRNLGDARYWDPAGPENEALQRVPQARRSLQLDWQLAF
ncbi:TonB-dependent receptor plug domain-containing protein [Roseateles microcysteis]|uniref:TonB-dependent receptor plug domain-containing protein n=1 Tax=Roseateles microcysteis TaxID=3119057 RepID=UPI002FE55F17